MKIVDRGEGSPIVLVPSLQGDWEYLAPAVDALASKHRVITFSLGDERGGLDGLAAQVEAALDDRGLERISPSRMGARALLIDGLDVEADCAAITAPTLVISGEPALDFVVPVAGTCEYAALVAGSRGVTLAHTHHPGCITRPAAFAALVEEFLRKQ
jgi:pimeloyl-ACP methyl ester carboxylesterase